MNVFVFGFSSLMLLSAWLVYFHQSFILCPVFLPLRGILWLNNQFSYFFVWSSLFFPRLSQSSTHRQLHQDPGSVLSLPGLIWSTNPRFSIPLSIFGELSNRGIPGSQGLRFLSVPSVCAIFTGVLEVAWGSGFSGRFWGIGYTPLPGEEKVMAFSNRLFNQFPNS
jgi:hypothetical protein